MNRIIIIGSATIDLVVYLPRSFQSGMFLQSNSFEKRFGGCGLNVASGLSSAKVDAALLSCIGDDDEGKEIIKNSQDIGLKISVNALPSTPTTSSFILVEPNGERTIIGLNGDLLPRISLSQLLSLNIVKEDIIIFPSWKSYFIELLDYVQTLGCKTVVGLRALADLNVKHADVAIGSEKEVDSLDSLLIDIQRFGKVIITHGAQGVTGFLEGKEYNQSSIQAQSVDATGAGDAFLAGYILGEFKGYSFQDCLLLGSIWGAKATETIGSIPPLYSEIEGAVKHLIEKRN